MSGTADTVTKSPRYRPHLRGLRSGRCGMTDEAPSERVYVLVSTPSVMRGEYWLLLGTGCPHQSVGCSFRASSVMPQSLRTTHAKYGPCLGLLVTACMVVLTGVTVTEYARKKTFQI